MAYDKEGVMLYEKLLEIITDPRFYVYVGLGFFAVIITVMALKAFIEEVKKVS